MACVFDSSSVERVGAAPFRFVQNVAASFFVRHLFGMRCIAAVRPLEYANADESSSDNDNGTSHSTSAVNPISKSNICVKYCVLWAVALFGVSYPVIRITPASVYRIHIVIIIVHQRAEVWLIIDFLRRRCVVHALVHLIHAPVVLFASECTILHSLGSAWLVEEAESAMVECVRVCVCGASSVCMLSLDDDCFMFKY